MKTQCSISQTRTRKTLNLLFYKDIEGLRPTETVDVIVMRIDLTISEELENLHNASTLGQMFQTVAENITKSATPGTGFSNNILEIPESLKKVDYSITYQKRTVGGLRRDWEAALTKEKTGYTNDIYVAPLFEIAPPTVENYEKFIGPWQRMKVASPA